MADRFSYSSAPQRKVKALQFGVLDAEFLVRTPWAVGRL